ncbi:MAG: hypothetical protein IM606_00550 [Cytophagales bacterium]|nr:hypothetical protein [Cytophagales bacterium]MCA6388241.1 hypothetical protein [Cytophagales bacterium]MCA6393097.1 hypothetical protein [Cytophagales bacterium]MCA6393650.1 hypothetical protein [Cytophagales bacterium]MCA6399864.1 hypothetical protein [Cytophagales bacterium]
MALKLKGSVLKTVLIWIGIGAHLVSWGQIKKQFSVEKDEVCNKVNLSLKAKTGNCFIRPSQSTDFLNIYSNQDLEQYSHSFSNEIKGTTSVIKLALEQESQRGVGKKISYQVFGSDDRPSEKFWKVYLTESTPYSLNLDYGLGNANIDLSGLSVEKLKINTGSADVNITYGTGIENKVTMDTFFIKVDMGTVTARHINLAKSKVVVANVGFGNMYLDFSDKPTTSNHIIGSVGAGNLTIQLPSDEVPVVVKINDSWLCSLNLSKSLKKVGTNKFANASYSKNAKNALNFDLDVSMGKIIFKDAK